MICLFLNYLIKIIFIFLKNTTKAIRETSKDGRVKKLKFFIKRLFLLLSSKYNFLEDEFKDLKNEIQKDVDLAWGNALKESAPKINIANNTKSVVKDVLSVLESVLLSAEFTVFSKSQDVYSDKNSLILSNTTTVSFKE